MNSLKAVRLIAAVALGGVSLFALSAQAEAPEGWYVGAAGGLSWNKTYKTNYRPVPGAQQVITTREGWGFNSSVGYNWGNNIRTEVEGAYSENSVRRAFDLAATGRTSTWSGFVNALYDFDLTPYGVTLPVVPYIGGGIGALNWGQSATGPLAIPASRTSGSHTAFAYQGIAGVAYNVTENWALTTDFRYISSPSGFIGSNHPRGVSNDMSQQQVMFGVRYSFPTEVPAPAPAHAAMQAAGSPSQAQSPAANSYLVFFDFDKYNLTTEAQRIVDNAASNAKGNKGVTKIDVTGHTDTVGSDAYNMKLSRRRADAVKAELVRQGIPANEIVVFAKGKRDPLVPTGDGVREPQNRRVEIAFK